jgi:hypothetical protein
LPALEHVVLALALWLTTFGSMALAWKGRLPMEMALLCNAVILLVVWGSPVALQP